MDIERRTVLQGAAALAAIGMSTAGQGEEKVVASPGNGKPGDFDFLTGRWTIQNRMIKPGTSDEWITFPAEATVWPILNGVGSVEELRIPARNFAGMGLRLLDVENKVWKDHWVNARSGVLTTPGQKGNFRDGVGTFTSEDGEGAARMIYRGVWDRITPTSCRWSQGSSRDGGKSWLDNWYMDWTRAA